MEQTLAPGAQNVSNILDAAQDTDYDMVERVIWQGKYGLSVANSEANIRWGLIVVNVDAFTSAVVPDPFGDHRASWYWNEFLSVDEPTVEFVHFRGGTATRRRIPSIQHRMILVFESDATSAGTLKYDIGLRILVSHK